MSLRILHLISLASAESSLRYFGFYGDDLFATSDFSNIHQAASVADAVAARQFGLDSLLYVGDLLWQTQTGKMVLAPGAADNVKAFASLGQSLLTNQTILGFNLGDELVWNCLAPSDLRAGASLIREAFPSGDAIIWYNEAAIFHGGPQVKDSCGNVYADFGIPEALDWFSMDIYHMDGVVQDWVASFVRKYYQDFIYPNLTSHQRVVLVPGSFGSDVNHYPNGTYVCDRHCYDQFCAHDADDFLAWAQQDERVVGIMPWNWGGCPTCNGSRWTPPHTCCMDEIGTKDQPLASAAWKRIGAQIKASLQVV